MCIRDRHIREKITVFVEYFNDTSSEWCPIENATVHFMGILYSTNATGYAVITVCIDPPVWAEKEGFVRSDVVEVKVVYQDIGGGGGWRPRPVLLLR